MLFVSESDLEFLTLSNRKLMEDGIVRSLIDENRQEYNCKHAFYEQCFIQNLKISWEINFYVKNTCKGKVITKKNILAHKNSSGPYYRATKSKVIFRSIFR